VERPVSPFRAPAVVPRNAADGNRPRGAVPLATRSIVAPQDEEGDWEDESDQAEGQET
jgi:hypothetical protein